jgi:hypothetical protein
MLFLNNNLPLLLASYHLKTALLIHIVSWVWVGSMISSVSIIQG